MKKTILSLCLLFVISFCYAQDVITNKTVISLSTVGLSPSIIINKIKTTKCSFDLSTDGLIALKQGKVSDEVINSMIEKQSTGNETGNAASDSITNKLPQSGIYYFSAQTISYVQLDPTLVTGTKNSTTLTGFKSSSILDGGESNLQTDNTPVFYFYFGKNSENKLNNTTASNITPSNDLVAMMQENSRNSKSSQAFSPNDFKLIKLDKSKRSRSFETGKISAFGGSSNGISKNITTFKYEAISPNLYKVFFPVGLQPGEYCFIYASSAASGGVMASMMNGVQHTVDVKVFDFGIKKVEK